MQINRIRSYLFAILIVIIALLGDVYYMTAFGLGLFVFALTDFVEKIGKTIPILEALLFIACLQWILGPYIDYVTEYKHYKYHMYVPEEAYMDLVVPSLFLLAIPVYYFSSQIDYTYFIKRAQQVKVSDQFSISLVVVGFVAQVAGRFAPDSLGFVFFLAYGLKFVGLLYLFYSNSKRKWLVFWIVMASQFLGALGEGIFHTLLLWSVFMFLFLLVFYPISYARKMLFLSLGFAGIFVLQSIKAEYRKVTWGGYSGNKVELFLALFFDKAGDAFKEDRMPIHTQKDEIGENNNRLNQGWIISKIMDNIPARAPYLEGETVREAIYSTLLPRFVDESKVGGGGGYAFEKLTGLHLLRGTAMGVSVIGEAYGNFGSVGTYLFMLVWGLFLGFFLKFSFKKSNYYYTLPLWLPIIFLQVIKAESDLFTVLNHLVKSSIFVFGLLYILKRVLGFSV